MLHRRFCSGHQLLGSTGENTMQYTNTMHPNSSSLSLDLTAKSSLFPFSHHSRSFPPKPFNSAACLENLLLHCAAAISSSDATLAQQIIWVLNNIAPPDGDPNQRLTSAILRALTTRAAISPVDRPVPHTFSAVNFASFVDLTPWNRFGFSASNSAIIDAVKGLSVVHVVDLSTTHCMQMPTLIDALASRQEGPPLLKLTVVAETAPPPPWIEISKEDLGRRLVSFARSRHVAMEFRVLRSDPVDGFSSLVDHLRVQQLVCDGEGLILNCQTKLHYLPVGRREEFLKGVRRLNPNLVTLVEEDVELCSGDLVTRLKAAFNYMWVHYDAADAVIKRGSEQRKWYEAEVFWKIENIVACEGLQRVERQEERSKWVKRMKGLGFQGVSFGEEALAEVKSMLDDHAAGWGMKKDEDGIVLTWKGHNVVFATIWVPC